MTGQSLESAAIDEIVRLYQTFVLDCIRERAAGFDCELVDLSEELAELLCIETTEAAALLYGPYRAAMGALKAVQP